MDEFMTSDTPWSPRKAIELWNDADNDLKCDLLPSDGQSPLLSETCASLLSLSDGPMLALRLEDSEEDMLGAIPYDADWTVKIDPELEWGLDSAGHSSLSSPTGFDDIFPNSSTTSFASSPAVSDSNFAFCDAFCDAYVSASAGPHLFSNEQENKDSMVSLKEEPIVVSHLHSEHAKTTSGEKGSVVSTARPKRRPPVSARSLLQTPKAGGGKPPARRRGRPEKDPRVRSASTVYSQGAIEPSTISLFSGPTNDGTLNKGTCGKSTGCAATQQPKSELLSQSILQQMNASRSDDIASRARAIALRKGQLRQNGCTTHRGAQAVSSSPTGAFLRKPVLMRKRMRECTMVCWLFRTLLTAEYRALPLNGIFEVFEDTFSNPSTAHGRHWRQSIRHCLMSSAVFVRVLTPNPRKDFLVMNEAGSWWTVHPDTEALCAREVFAVGAGHRCPPQQGMPYRLRLARSDDRQQYERRGSAFLGERIYRTPPPLAQRRMTPRAQLYRTHFFQHHYQHQTVLHHHLFHGQLVSQVTDVAPPIGDHLVVDHEEEVC